MNKEGEMARVLDITQLNLKQIRLVAKKLGFRPAEPLLSVKEVNGMYLKDKMEESRGDARNFDEALGLTEDNDAEFFDQSGSDEDEDGEDKDEL
jgi:hypothetical protein